MQVLIGKAVPYTLVSWRPFKIPRVCRSSLAAEAEACAMALDELMIVKVFFGMMLDPSKGIADSAELYGRGKCAIVTDAKALCDAVKRENISQSLDKRAALEILCVKDAINSLKAEWRWVSSERQMADGLTKLAAQQDMADVMSYGMVQLVHDPEFTATKKKTHKEIEKSRESMTGTIRKKNNGKGAKSGSKVADAIMVAMAAGSATGANAERPAMVD